MTVDLSPMPEGYPIKLVRDRTSDVLNSSGKPGELFYKPLKDAAQRLRWLKAKLGEEVWEYGLGGDFVELLDVLAVVEALCIEHGRTIEEARREMHSHPRGGFRRGMMMYGRHKEFDGR